jgi:hypothetical protein
MRTIETALWPLERPSEDVGLGVLLGGVSDPEFAGLAEGERVLLIEPNELQVEATIRKLMVNSRTVWFGEIGDPTSIQVIYPSSSQSSSIAAHAPSHEA